MERTYKHSYKAEQKQMASLFVYNAGYQKCSPGYQWGHGIRNHYLIHHVLAGQGYYEVHGCTYCLKRGDTFLVYPDTEVRYYADRQKPWEYTWVGFAGNDVVPILQNTDFTKEMPIIHQANISSQIQREFQDIYSAAGNDFSSVVEMTGKLYVALSTLMKNSVGRSSEDSAATYVKRAAEYIGRNYSYPITIDDVASYVGISRSHLFRIFKEELKQPPKEYLVGRRLEQAKVLLTETSLSVTAIARSVGFEDSLYFSKVFKKKEGMTPSTYRKEGASL